MVDAIDACIAPHNDLDEYPSIHNVVHIQYRYDNREWVRTIVWHLVFLNVEERFVA